MGWWGVERDGKEIEIGDKALDTMTDALKKVAKMYRRDLKRVPTPEEYSEILEKQMHIFEEELFDDMDEREIESVIVKLRPRPKRPRPKPGDYFAIPLASGGYGYGRIMKVTHRILMWMRLLAVRSNDLLSVDVLRAKRVSIDLRTSTHKIDSVQWPIVGHLPLSQKDEEVLANEPTWITGYPPELVEEIAEWRLSGKHGLPSSFFGDSMPVDFIPYEGYSQWLGR